MERTTVAEIREIVNKIIPRVGKGIVNHIY